MFAQGLTRVPGIPAHQPAISKRPLQTQPPPQPLHPPPRLTTSAAAGATRSAYSQPLPAPWTLTRTESARRRAAPSGTPQQPGARSCVPHRALQATHLPAGRLVQSHPHPRREYPNLNVHRANRTRRHRPRRLRASPAGARHAARVAATDTSSTTTGRRKPPRPPGAPLSAAAHRLTYAEAPRNRCSRRHAPPLRPSPPGGSILNRCPPPQPRPPTAACS